jgi:hypothetical protein
MPAGNELAQRPGVGNETVECISLRKLSVHAAHKKTDFSGKNAPAMG